MSDIIYFGRYNSSESLGGSEKFIKRIFEHSEANQHNIWFIDFYFGYKSGNIVKKFFGYDKLNSGEGKHFLRLGLFRILLLIIKKKVKIFILNGLEGYAIFILMLLKSFFKIEFNYVMHGIYLFELKYDKNCVEPLYYKLKYSLMEKLIIRLADRIITFSRMSGSQIKKYYPAGEKKIIRIKSGVDEEFFYLKTQFNLSSPLKMIYSGGTGRALKGFDFLCDTLKRLEIKTELHLCGKIADKTRLQDYLENLNKNINVRIIGNLDASTLAMLYRECDLFLLPSKFESFSIATAEAAASSLVPVITDSTGISEYLADGFDCLKVEYDNSDYLLQKIEYLHNNRSEIERIGRNAYKTMQNFRWKLVSDELFSRIK